MLDKKQFFENKDFEKLAEATQNKDYDTVTELCDKFLAIEGLDDIEGTKTAFEKIKTAAEQENEEAISDGFFDLVKCSSGEKDTKSAKQFVNDCILAIKSGNIKKAQALSKEYADITADAMRTSGKPKLADDFLLELSKASINKNNKKLRKLLKKIQ